MTILQVGDPNFLLHLGQVALDSLVDTLAECEQDIPPRRVVSFTESPEDCCPDLNVWIDNFRVWDGSPFDGLQLGYLSCTNMWAVDISVRIGRCYIDVDQTSLNPLSAEDLAELSAQIYRDGNILYLGWIAKLRDNEICNLPRYTLGTVSSLLAYNDGGCAGWRFTITLGFS